MKDQNEPGKPIKKLKLKKSTVLILTQATQIKAGNNDDNPSVDVETNPNPTCDVKTYSEVNC